MTTRTKKTKVYYLATLLPISLMIFFACSTTKETTSNSNPKYNVKHVPNSEVDYEGGNVIVVVFDSENQELTGAKITLFSKDEKIGELELKSTSMGVFYKEQKTISVLVTKEGYDDVQTNNIEMTSDKACLVDIRLPKK